jgi:hypothetical protein
MKNKNLWFYDLEVAPNFFSATFWNGVEKKVFILHESKKIFLELGNMLDWIKKQENLVLVGFNSISYDNTILTYLIENYERLILTTLSSEITNKIFKLSGYIINYDKQSKDVQQTVRHIRAASSKYFQSIDILEVIREGYSTKSLKGVAINLKWKRIQDLPYKYDDLISEEQIEEVLDYNFNDVLITELAFNHIIDRLEMREILSEQFGLNLLSSADSTIAKNLFDKFYSEGSGLDIEEFKYKRTKRKEVILKDIILDWVEFKTPVFQEYLEKLKEVRVTNIDEKAEFDIPPLIVGDMEYTIGLGGIHSVDKPGIFEALEGMMLLDLDVASQYPRRIIHSKIVPAHLDQDVFVEILERIVNLRLQKKGEGKKDKIARIIAEGLKITINTVYGLYNFMYYFLYDPLATYKVTVNNQLAILMLIEELGQHGINIISANTDGIICYTDSSNLDLIRSIYREWEKTTGFTLEETNYSKYIRRDINNYITIKTDGEVKNKGIFIPQNGILKGYDKPIVSIALQEYFLHGQKPEDVINNLGLIYKFVNPEFPKGEWRQTDIYDYCMAKKVGDTFDSAIFTKNETKEVMQKNIRYYASTDGGVLYKTKDASNHNMLVDSKVTIFNDYFPSDDYKINMEYYIQEAYKIISKVEGKKYIDPKKLQETIDKTKIRYDELVAKLHDMISKNKSHLKSFQVLVTQTTKVEQELNSLIQQKDES